MADVNKEIALKVTTDTSQTNSAFKSTKQELRETQKAMVDLALAGKQGTEEFKRLEQRAGVIKDTIGDMGQRVNNLANDTPRLELLTQAATGIAGGFAVAQGAAALFGDENEEVQKAIMKTQGAMTLLNGVQSIANVINKDAALGDLLAAKAKNIYTFAVGKSTGALKLFRSALLATGVGAVVVAVGMLVANFDKVTEAVTKFVSGSAPLTKVLKFIGDTFTSIGESLGFVEDKTTKNLRTQIAAAEKQKRLLEAQGKDTEAVERSILTMKLDLAKKTKEGVNEAQEAITLFDAEQTFKREELAKKDAEKRIENSLKVKQQIISDLTAEMNFRKEIGEDVTALEEKILREKLRYAELTKTGIVEAQTALRLFLMQGSIDAEKLAKDDADKKVEAEKDAQQKLKEIQNEIRRSKLTDYQREREDFLLQRAQMLELMRASGAEAIELQLFAQNTEQLAKQMDADRKIEIDKETAKREKEIQEQATQARFDIVLGGLQAIGDLAASFAGKSEEQQKKAFNVQKAANIAMATIETYLSAASAYKSQLLIPTPDAPIRAAIAAGVAIASGLARVAAISKTQFKSTAAPTNTGGGGSIPNPSGGGQQPPAAFSPNVTATNPTGQPNPQGGQSGTTRVIVVESDIRRVTTRVDAAERFATFG